PTSRPVRMPTAAPADPISPTYALRRFLRRPRNETISLAGNDRLAPLFHRGTLAKGNIDRQNKQTAEQIEAFCSRRSYSNASFRWDSRIIAQQFDRPAGTISAPSRPLRDPTIDCDVPSTSKTIP